MTIKVGMMRLRDSLTAHRKWLRSPVWRLRLIACMIAVAVMSVAIVTVDREHKHILADEEATLLQLSAMSAHRIGSRMELVDHHLQEIRAEIQAVKPDSTAALGAFLKSQSLRDHLEQFAHQVPIATIAVFDRLGNLLINSNFDPILTPPPNVSDGPIFRRLRDQPLSTKRVVSLSQHAINRKPVIAIGRVFMSPTGEFLGAVVAGIDIEALSASESGLIAKYGNELTLMSVDGTILMRYPYDPKILGMPLRQPRWHEVAAAGGGAYRSQGVLKNELITVWCVARPRFSDVCECDRAADEGPGGLVVVRWFVADDLCGGRGRNGVPAGGSGTTAGAAAGTKFDTDGHGGGPTGNPVPPDRLR